MRRLLDNMSPPLTFYWEAIARFGVLVAARTRETAGGLAGSAAESDPSSGLPTCSVPLTLSDIRSDRIKAFDSYWQFIRQGRDFPAKQDIDPAAIKAALPYMNIVELHGPPLRVRYRLVGTELCRIYNEDYTGKWLHETHWGVLVRNYENIYAELLTRRRPLLGVGQIEWEGRIITHEWGKWPLSDDGVTITHCVGMEDYAHVPSSDPVMITERD